MRNIPDRESIFQETMAQLSAVSSDEGSDVLLHCFMSVLGGLDARAARQLSDELSTRFGGRYCSGQVCRMMAELVNGHLASRPPHPRN
jgi:hypothetical protein